jgi:hypothetical protein
MAGREWPACARRWRSESRGRKPCAATWYSSSCILVRITQGPLLQYCARDVRSRLDGWGEVTPRGRREARQNSVAARCVVRTWRCSSSAGGRLVDVARLVRVGQSDPTTDAIARREGGRRSFKGNVTWTDRGRFAEQVTSVSWRLQAQTTMGVATFTWPLIPMQAGPMHDGMHLEGFGGLCTNRRRYPGQVLNQPRWRMRPSHGIGETPD